ncbi:uncharacterized protein BO80DRAFT_329421, partial [Aspergillus ibericus CBS 121593]
DRAERPAERKEYWCQANEKIKWFEIASKHLLHEMTHLDAAGQQAGYAAITDADGNISHGTLDVSGGRYIEMARRLATRWQQNEASCKKKNAMLPYRNADSATMSVLGK